MESQINAHLLETDDVKGQLELLQKDLDLSQNRVNELIESRAKSRRKIEALEVALQEKDRCVLELETDLDETTRKLTHDSDDLKSEVKHWKEKAESLELHAVECQGNVADKEAVAVLTDKLRSSELHIERSEGEIFQLTTELENAKKVIKEVTIVQKLQEQELVHIQHEASRAKVFEAELKQAREELAELELARVRTERELTMELSMKTEALTLLEEVKSDLEVMTLQNKALKENTACLEKELEGKTSALEAADKKSAALLSRVQELEESTSDIEKIRSEAEAALEGEQTHKAVIRSLTLQLASLSQEAIAAITEKDEVLGHAALLKVASGTAITTTTTPVVSTSLRPPLSPPLEDPGADVTGMLSVLQRQLISLSEVSKHVSEGLGHPHKQTSQTPLRQLQRQLMRPSVSSSENELTHLRFANLALEALENEVPAMQSILNLAQSALAQVSRPQHVPPLSPSADKAVEKMRQRRDKWKARCEELECAYKAEKVHAVQLQHEVLTLEKSLADAATVLGELTASAVDLKSQQERHESEKFDLQQRLEVCLREQKQLRSLMEAKKQPLEEPTQGNTHEVRFTETVELGHKMALLAAAHEAAKTELERRQHIADTLSSQLDNLQQERDRYKSREQQLMQRLASAREECAHVLQRLEEAEMGHKRMKEDLNTQITRLYSQMHSNVSTGSLDPLLRGLDGLLCDASELEKRVAHLESKAEEMAAEKISMRSALERRLEEAESHCLAMAKEVGRLENELRMERQKGGEPSLVRESVNSEMHHRRDVFDSEM